MTKREATMTKQEGVRSTMAASEGLVLGIDIGTYETKGALVDPAGTIVAMHRRPHRVSFPRPGFAEHDPITVWWKGFLETTAELLSKPGVNAAAIRAVAVSGIGPCVLPLDSSGNPLRDAILYGVDGRAGLQIRQIEDRLGDDEIRRRCGTSLSAQSAGPKILWLEQEEPETFERTAMFVTCQTFITSRLTGDYRMDHATAAYFHPFYDRRAQRWNVGGLRTNLTEDQLPRLGWSSEILGSITPGAARETGLPIDVPVLVGAPDAPSEALSAGIAKPGEMMVMYGSSHFIIEVVDRPHDSPTLWPAPFLFPGTHLVAAGTSTAGSFTRWYTELLSSGSGGADELYEQMAREADTSPPGANGLLAMPYLSGERTPLNDPGARGGFLGLSMRHSRADIARSIAEGIAQSACAAISCFADEGLAPSKVRAVGGGTKNDAWVQAVSDISCLPQEVTRTAGASYGDAILAANVAGFIDSNADLTAWCKPVGTVRPRPEFQDLYARQRVAFQRFYESTRDVVETLQTLAQRKGQS